VSMTLDETLKFTDKTCRSDSLAGILAAEVRRLSAEIERLTARIDAVTDTARQRWPEVVTMEDGWQAMARSRDDAEAALAESRNNDRIAMSWIADIKKTVRGEDMDLPALLRHLQTLTSHVQEWFCPVCNTVHVPPKGFNLSCPTLKCKGTLKPSSMAIRRVEDQRDGLLAAMKEIKEMLSRHRRFGEGRGAMHTLVGAEEAAETAISKAGVPS